jgi:hypothetical protein
MRQLIGVGTPRALQGRLGAVLAALVTLIRLVFGASNASSEPRVIRFTAQAWRSPDMRRAHSLETNSLIKDRHDRSRVLHCRAWRWANDGGTRSRYRCG